MVSSGKVGMSLSYLPKYLYQSLREEGLEINYYHMTLRIDHHHHVR